MSELHPASPDLAQDLAYIRGAVARRDRERPDLFGVYLAWAFYIVIGYALLDVRPAWANAFFAIAWIPAALAAYLSRRRAAARGGIADPVLARRAGLHYGGGIALSIAAALGLAAVLPQLRGPASGQVVVVLVGVVYFLGGVHFDRRFLVLGPIMILGGLAIGFMPYLPWTTLGLVIAAGLVLPSFFKRKAGVGGADVES